MSLLRNPLVPRQQIFCRPTRIGGISHGHVSLIPLNCYDMVKRTDPSLMVQFPVSAGSIKGLGTAKSIYLGFDPLLCTLLPSVLPSVSSKAGCVMPCLWDIVHERSQWRIQVLKKEGARVHFSN